jgi:type IV secretory pathway VirB2 component (pilin)
MAKIGLMIIGCMATFISVVGFIGYALDTGSPNWPLLIIILIGVGMIYLGAKIKE